MKDVTERTLIAERYFGYLEKVSAYTVQGYTIRRSVFEELASLVSRYTGICDTLLSGIISAANGCFSKKLCEVVHEMKEIKGPSDSLYDKIEEILLKRYEKEICEKHTSFQGMCYLKEISVLLDKLSLKIPPFESIFEKMFNIVFQNTIESRKKDIINSANLREIIETGSHEKFAILDRIFSVKGRKYLSFEVSLVLVSIFEKSELFRHTFDIKFPKRPREVVLWARSIIKFKSFLEAFFEKCGVKNEYYDTICGAIWTILSFNEAHIEHLNIFLDSSIRSNREIAEDIFFDSRNLDKSAFEECYIKFLSKRLLFCKNVKMERVCLCALRSKKIGTFYLSERLLNELVLCDELVERFNLTNNKNLIPFSPCIFPRSTCSLKSSNVEKLPKCLKDCIFNFTNFYKQNVPNRSLVWNMSLGTSLLRIFTTGDKFKDVLLPTFSMIILIKAFTCEKIDLAYGEIVSVSKIPKCDILTTLSLLSSEPNRILIKYPENAPLERARFRLNLQDADFLIEKIKMSYESLDRKKSRKLHETSEDFKHRIEAELVRILKKANAMSYECLIQECSAKLGAISQNTLNSCLSGLEERDYIRKTHRNSTSYEYVP